MTERMNVAALRSMAHALVDPAGNAVGARYIFTGPKWLIELMREQYGDSIDYVVLSGLKDKA